MQHSPFLAPVSVVVTLAPWAKSLAIVAGLHLGAAGVAGARIMLAPVADDIAGGETVIEFSPVVASAESVFTLESADHDAEDRPATSHLDETLSKKREVDLPTEQASPTTPVDEDLRLAQERTLKESDTQTEVQTSEAMVEQKQEQSSQANTVAEAAPEQMGQTEGDVARAPDEGNAAEARRKIEDWQRRIFTHIVRFKHYPEQARAKRLGGEALVSFTLDADGRVSDVQVVRSAGHALLDQAAVAVLQRANPLPKPPVQLAGSNLAFTLPMRFSAK
ncbi:MAG: hypothetical protein CFE31_17470 [Rhizobiales bacterium PAR1]|nr:MAG: hypothetical protein CFE31_17470 [Rhizobiales bacterium PAR1]